jgi:serine/threonine protein kinase
LILGEIARGGMGVVYLARQNNLKREVALKLILAGVLASRREIEQFHIEAEAAAALNHPHIVHVYESGEHEGQPFVAMELIQGSSLAEKLEEGAWRFTSTNAAERQTQLAGLVLKLAEAVHHAHQRGVIHRDLKPSNVLLNEEGEPFVTDFSLAKLMGGSAGLTQTGQVLGTPSFMSPEQAAGRRNSFLFADWSTAIPWSH